MASIIQVVRWIAWIETDNDMYRSLGCTVIELYTGKPPYADLLTMTAMFKIVEDDCPPLPEGISDVRCVDTALAWSGLIAPCRILKISWSYASKRTQSRGQKPFISCIILGYHKKTEMQHCHRPPHRQQLPHHQATTTIAPYYKATSRRL